MRTIAAEEITRVVGELAINAAHHLEPDILDRLVAVRDLETEPLAKNILEVLLQNAEIASREHIPLCQDTGISVVFARIGHDVRVQGDLMAAIQEGVRIGYEEGFLRKSVCDPITRTNTGTNFYAVIHLETGPGDRIAISFLPKGCGSENMSGLTMLPPSAGTSGIKDFVVERVFAAGSNPCPPITVGVGVGGTMEMAALLSKKALLRPLGRPHARPDVAELEDAILTKINASGLGPLGLGGKTTALAVHIEVFPTHIASLPVAVNIQCHAHRYKEIVI